MDLASHQDSILILDFGSQYTQLLARRVREANVYSSILPFNASIAQIKRLRPKGLILSGGPSSSYHLGAPKASPKLFSLGIPILGICYGMQVIVQTKGGRVSSTAEREYGPATLKLDDTSDLFDQVGGKHTRTPVWMSHGDRIDRLPPGFTAIAHTANAPIAAMRDRTRKIFGLQFHPEVIHTPKGTQMLRNFVYRVCGCRGTWDTTSWIDPMVATVRKQARSGRIICALSGGVDSTVAAALTHRAVGDRLTCVFVNNGLLRANESAFQTCNLRKSHGLRLVCQGADPLPSVQDAIPPYRIQLVKCADHVIFSINALEIFDWVDDGETYGPRLGGGKIGFRQMAPLIGEYANLLVRGVKRVEEQ